MAIRRRIKSINLGNLKKKLLLETNAKVESAKCINNTLIKPLFNLKEKSYLEMKYTCKKYRKYVIMKEIPRPSTPKK